MVARLVTGGSPIVVAAVPALEGGVVVISTTESRILHDGITCGTIREMPRVVLDTSVLVAAVRSRRGASFDLISRLGSADFDIAVSVPLVLEYEAALLRHVAASPLNERDIRDLIDYVCHVAIRQDVFFLWRPFLPDPGDDLVLELAIAAGCDAIVTHNLRDFRGSDQLGVRAVTPGRFAQELRERKWAR